MEWLKILETVLILVVVLALMVGALFSYRKFVTFFPRAPYVFGDSPVRVEYRYAFDTKNYVLRFRDEDFSYTVLIGERPLLLEKKIVEKDSLNGHS